MTPCLPDRASDAGPDPIGEPMKWYDHLEAAAEEIHMAERTYRDDVDVQRKLRREKIEAAIEELRMALEVLP